MQRANFLIALAICSLGVSCSKGSEDDVLTKNGKETDLHSSVTRLSYGEKMFYVTDAKANTPVFPIAKPDFEGHFVSIPAGLALDRNTGAINLGKSMVGQPYKIFYVNGQGILTDSVRIVIGGLDYADGFYDSKDLNARLGKDAKAIYSGDETSPVATSFFNSFKVSVRNTDDESEDETGLSINKRNGTIDLEKSKAGGLFGNSPSNGAYRELVIKYRLADKSARKLNKQSIRLFYYENKKSVPRSLINLIETRKQIMERVNAMPLPGHSSGGEGGVNATEEGLGEYNMIVRPPLIIVVN